MHNSDVKVEIRTCEGCGVEVKDGKGLCRKCDAAKEVMTKGIEHTRSSKAVIGLKRIDEMGLGWAQSLTV
jgi:hypothetical protein